MITPPKVTAITSASYTKIVVDDQPGIPIPISFYTEDQANFYVATDSSGSNEALVHGTQSPVMLIKPDDDGAIMYVKGTTSTNLIVLRGLG